MSETVFKKVDYELGSLVNFIELGEIGLPDIQRPFVWNNGKVRDLFDSMYRGYPVGYLLLWQNGQADDRTIGADRKQKTATLVVVDGQQRLTSLYAVIKGVPVVRSNYQTERIHIAFNPLEQRFEVADAAIQRDKAFISDISSVWSQDTNLFRVKDHYLASLRTSRAVTDMETKQIEVALVKLHSLLSFPFTALELRSDITEQDVSDVFVRINSRGTPLNQADFILTLMSVFWDDGRAELERFAREARKPTKGSSSPFNYFIEPTPDQLLRVGVGVAFKRARLQYVYSILRGKDLDTGQFSDTHRVLQFNILKGAQDRVLNVQYWHDFMNCIRTAGFRSSGMISSKNNLLFAYMLYLIGRTEYDVPAFTLRKVIARWFFMSAVTGRFTGSPESAMEFDLARLRHVTTPDQFVTCLNQVCDITLTNDFWGVTLPNNLATSSPRSPSLFAYNAALVLLDAPVLFSTTKVSDLLDPAIQANRSMLERHHLFPKAYLATLGITETRETNQIANYALVEWPDNSDISGKPPIDYVPYFKSRFTEVEMAKMYYCHALPKDWELMDYQSLLERRRETMAQIIREAYQKLTTGPVSDALVDEFAVTTLIERGESEATEFKSTLRTNLHTDKTDKRMELEVLKTLAGFMNTQGGTLIIGISDNGTPVGIEADKFSSEDRMSLHFVSVVNTRMGPEAMTRIHLHFEDYHDCRVLVARCSRSPVPVFVKDEQYERFFIRTGPATTELTVQQAHNYLTRKFVSQ